MEEPDENYALLLAMTGLEVKKWRGVQMVGHFKQCHVVHLIVLLCSKSRDNNKLSSSCVESSNDCISSTEHAYSCHQ